VVREHGLAAANVFARIGAGVSPLFAFMQYQLRSGFVSLLVLGSFCLAAAFLAVLLPETLGEKVPETIQELNVLLSMRRRRSWRVALAGMLRPSTSQPSLPGARASSTSQQPLDVVAVIPQRTE
jgi:hypothetical protein